MGGDRPSPRGVFCSAGICWLSVNNFFFSNMWKTWELSWLLLLSGGRWKAHKHFLVPAVLHLEFFQRYLTKQRSSLYQHSLWSVENLYRNCIILWKHVCPDFWTSGLTAMVCFGSPVSHISYHTVVLGLLYPLIISNRREGSVCFWSKFKMKEIVDISLKLFKYCLNVVIFLLRNARWFACSVRRTCVRAGVSSWHSLSAVDILPKIK